MKVAYLTTYDSDDITKWSGLGYYMRKCLSDQGVEVIPVNCSAKQSLLQQIRFKLSRIISGKTYQMERHPDFLRSVAEIAEKKLQHVDHDIVFSPGSLAVSYLKSDRPVVVWTDATFDCLSDFYNSSIDLDSRSVTHGNMAEQQSINNASLIFYSSEWGRASAINTYRADPEKVKQLPFGSNIDHEESIETVSGYIANRIKNSKIRLLFVGIDWNRKGGSYALATAEELNKKGFNTKLIIVGCTPPEAVQTNPHVELYPFISKHTANGVQQLKKLYETATFFILPSIAECTPVVFSEAASYGLPVLTTNVGGLSSIVKHNQTGFCFPVNGFAESATDAISILFSDKQKYNSISLKSFDHYCRNLNWKVSGQKAVNAMNAILTGKSDPKNNQ